MAEVGSLGDLSDHSCVGSVNLDIEELDDDEYNIPPVEHTPTLESILNDLDDRTSASEDELSNSLLPPAEGTFEGSETLSLGSVGSVSRSSSERRQTKTNTWSGTAPNTQRTGSILRHVILKGISTQLVSACERSNAGLPTAMAATTMIAVGTSHGLVLVFDASQRLRWCLGSTDQEQGSVSSLGFNHDCSRLLVGFARGLILMYDILNGKLLRTMADAHPPGTAVLHVKFTDSPTLALCSDSGGSVFELNFRRTMGMRGCDSKCLFSGSRGEVVCIEPLLLHHQQLSSHPLQGVILIAMATLSKVIVVSIRPRMRVLFTHPLQSSPVSLPLISWQFVIIQMADTSRVVDPVLAFARDSTLHFFQVSVDNKSKVRFVALQRLSVGYQLLSLHWLNTRTLAVLDTLEQLHLVDVRSHEELEVLDLAAVGLVYATAHFKGLATGGNVSKALALAGEHACYNSVVSFGSQLLLLGTKTFHVLSIRTWNDRLAHLVRQDRYLEALSLGMDFYHERGKAVIGLKGPKTKRKEIIWQKVLEILNIYIDETLIHGGSTDTYQESIPACVEYCVSLDVMDLLFGKLWDTCSNDEGMKAVYLESLEPWLLNDRLRHVPPIISQQFVSHYENLGNLQTLEECLVHMDVASLDIHQVMGLCWSQGLYNAIIYIHNKALMDYVTPLQELMPILQAALSTGKQLTDQQIALGNKLLVYISCCLAGRAYPVGYIPSDMVASVKHEVFKCLTCLHSKDAPDSEPPYPYLRVLLHFDTREFLNVLALAFEEPEFLSEVGMRQVQRLVDILLLIMVQGEGFTPSQVGSLFTFLARQLARPWCGLLHVERQLFEQVVEFLTEGSGSPSTGHHEERQQALLELIRAGGLQHYDQDRLLTLAHKAYFYRVCELLYEQRHEYDKILQCYLWDPLRKPQVFSYLRNILLLYNNTAERSKVEAQVVDNIKELLDIDAVKTAQIIVLHLPQTIPKILRKLDLEPEVLYQFLHGLFDFRDSHANLSHLKDDLTLEPQLVEQYIQLMCQYDPAKVYSFITSFDGYRLDNTLKITRKYEQTDATAYLLEKTGDFQGALQLLLGHLNSRIDLLITTSRDGVNKVEEETAVRELTTRLVELCRRGSATLDEAGRHSVWFPLLDSLMRPQRNETTRLLVLQELTQQLLMAMSSFVSLPAMLQVVLQDPAYAGGKFGDIRELMMGMLSNSCYEETLLQATSRLLSSDLHQQLAKHLAAANRGMTPRLSTCSMCRQMITHLRDNESVVLFRCGHAYHSDCMKDPPHCYVCRWGRMPAPLSINDPQGNSSSSSSAATSPHSQELLIQSPKFPLQLSPPPPRDLEGIF
ncbi:vacuolar protein sorting-associated protein 8 homolog [Schistocerca nitens]|uniref:vacuolar protein sorting-associated protein 8 homolog n=1 Tax=Schistocerca nitens TaxID=7011 RepID=UPI002117A13B|nr:vacuolar protein sorting-associated protein 8 homolog [Schistocerca nitens]